MPRSASPITEVVTLDDLIADLKIVVTAGLGRRLHENRLSALRLVVARLGDQDPPDFAAQVEQVVKPSVQGLGDSTKPGKAAPLLFGTAEASAHLRQVGKRREMAAEIYGVTADAFSRTEERRICAIIANDLLNRYRAAASDAGQTSAPSANGHDERSALGTSRSRRRETITALDEPTAMTLDPIERRLFVVERGKHRVVQVDLADGSVAPVAGVGERGFSGDGMDARLARLSRPDGVAFDHDRQLLYIADTDNHRIRRVHLPTGQITTIAGTGRRWPCSQHRSYLPPIWADRLPATRTKLAFPRGLALSNDGTQVFIAAPGSSSVRVLYPATGWMRVLAGNGKVADTGDGHRPRRISLAVPVRLALDVDHLLLYVSQERSPTVRWFGVAAHYFGSHRQEIVQVVPDTDIGTRPANHREAFNHAYSGSVIALDQSKNCLYVSASPGIACVLLPDGPKSTVPGTDDLQHIGDIVFDPADRTLYVSLSSEHRVVRIALH